MIYNTKRTLVALFLAGFSTIGLTQTTSNKNMTLSANTKAGCLVQAEDFNFGNVDIPNMFTQSVTANIKLQCSKGSNIYITQNGLIENWVGGFGSNYLTLNNTGIRSTNAEYYYYLKTNLIQTNENYTLIFKNSNNNIGVASYSGQSYSVQIKTKTIDAFSLPLIAQVVFLPKNYGYLLLPGNYGDTVTYSLTF